MADKLDKETQDIILGFLVDVDEHLTVEEQDSFLNELGAVITAYRHIIDNRRMDANKQEG